MRLNWLGISWVRMGLLLNWCDDDDDVKEKNEEEERDDQQTDNDLMISVKPL